MIRMADVWKNKIDQADQFISSTDRIIKKTAVGKTELLQDLYEKRNRMADAKSNLIIAYMRCL